MRKTSVTVSKWCAGIVSILGMILYICSAIFFYRFLQIDYKWADGIGWPGVIGCVLGLITVIFEKDFGRYLKKYSRIVHTVLLTYLLFSGEFLGIDIIQQMMITVFSLSGMALLLILCVVFMLADHSDKSMNRNHIRNSMFPMILMIVDVIILGNAEQFYCATLIALIVLAYMIWEYQGSVKIKICYALVIIMTIIGIYLWHRISYLSGPILEEWFNGIRVKYIAHSWGLGKYCEYGLIFIILAIVLIYMYRVTRQYLRSEDRMIMHYAWIQSVMWVFQIWIPKFQRKTRGELPFMTANWLNNVMYAFQFVLIINIFMNKIKIENER